MNSSHGSCSSSSCCFPYGLLIVTTLYLAFVLILEYTIPIECLNEPCHSEGLDTSILGFATDFGIATAMILFGLQLRCGLQRPVHASAVYAQLYMGIGYIFGGLGHSIFTNSGFNDNVGQQEFYIMWICSFTFLTASAYQIYRFTRKVQQRYHAVVFTEQGSKMLCLLQLSLCLVIASWVATMTGYIWCATETSIHVDTAIDSVPSFDENQDDEDNNNDLHVCLQIASAGEVSWYVTFALLWIPVSWILRQVILHDTGRRKGNEQTQPRKVYGFYNSWAALWIAIIPWTFGIMLIVWSGLAALIVGQDATVIYDQIYGAVVYHYGMLLGFYLFHNIAYSLPKHETVLPSDSSSNKVEHKGHDDHDLELADLSVY